MKGSRLLVLALAAALWPAACGIRGRPALPDPNAGTIVTAAEVARTEATTMWEALQRTVRHVRFEEAGAGKPARVHRRGSSSIVLVEDMPIYIDRVRIPNVSVLAALPAGDILRIQVLTGVHATTFYGTNAGDGVILIRTRGGYGPHGGAAAREASEKGGAPPPSRDAPTRSR